MSASGSSSPSRSRSLLTDKPTNNAEYARVPQHGKDKKGPFRKHQESIESMSSFSKYLQRYNVLLRALSVVVVPGSIYALSGSVLSACSLGPLLLVATSAYCLTALVATFACVLSVYALPLVAEAGTQGALFLVESSSLAAALLALAVIGAARHRLIILPDAASRIGRFSARHARGFRSVLLAASVILAIAVFFEASDPVQAMLWAILLFLIRRQFPAPAPARTSSARSAMISVAIVLVLTILLAALLEFLTRKMYRDSEAVLWTQSGGVYQPDEEYLFTTRPSASASYSICVGPGKRRAAEQHTSSQGLFDHEIGPKEPGEFRILMLGDSFTAGHGVQSECSIPKMLERTLRKAMPAAPLSVVNAGVGGYAPWQERGFLNRTGFVFEPDLVILQLYPANDVENTLIKSGKYNWRNEIEWRERVRKAVYSYRWQVKASRWIRGHCSALTLLGHVSDPPFDFVRFWNALRFVPDCAMDPLPERQDRSELLECELDEYYPELQEAMSTMIEDVRGIIQDCRGRGIDVITFCIPCLDVLTDDRFEAAAGQLKPPLAYDRFKSTRLIHAALDGDNASYLDLTADLRAQPNPEDFYFIYDGHLNEDGDRFVAERLADYLVNEYLPERGLPGPG